MVIENTPSQGLTLDQAFTQLKASRDQSLEEDHLENDDADVVADDEEVVEDLDTDDQTADDEDGDGQDSEGDDGDSDGEGDEEEPEVWEIEVEGETVEVTTEELHKGYLRNNDYTRKRQADAKVARELKTEYDSKLSELTQALAQNVSQDQQQLNALQAQYGQATDEAAKRSIHYQMLQLQQNIGARSQASNQAAQLQQQAQQAQAEAYWSEQEDILRGQYEDWESKKVELKTYLESQGFEDLSMFGHAAMANLVDKAQKFDDMQQKRKTVAKKKIRRKVPNVLKPGQGEKTFRADQRLVQDLEKRFAKSGSIKDAQALMRAKRGK